MLTKITWTLKNQMKDEITKVRDLYEAYIDELLANQVINGDEWIQLHSLIQERWLNLQKLVADAWFNEKEIDLNPNWIQDNLRLCIEE